MRLDEARREFLRSATTERAALPFYFPSRLLSARCSLNDLRVVALERGVGLESRDLAMSDAKL